jgi:hypothetical protein
MTNTTINLMRRVARLEKQLVQKRKNPGHGRISAWSTPGANKRACPAEISVWSRGRSGKGCTPNT